MLLLGHTGITLGIATLLNGAAIYHFSLARQRMNSGEHREHNSKTRLAPKSAATSKPFSFTALGALLDIRLLLLGSLLPDIIDKPLGQIIFRESFNNGRIFTHTFLFLILITTAGYYLYRKRQKIWLLTLAMGTFTHIILDEMWFSPKTLLWPMFGLAFEKLDLTFVMYGMLQALFTNPKIYLSEMVGLAILVTFAVVLIRRKKVRSFIKYGRVR